MGQCLRSAALQRGSIIRQEVYEVRESACSEPVMRMTSQDPVIGIGIGYGIEIAVGGQSDIDPDGDSDTDCDRNEQPPQVF